MTERDLVDGLIFGLQERNLSDKTIREMFDIMLDDPAMDEE